MKKLLLFLTIAVVSAGSIKAMADLEQNKQHAKHMKRFSEDMTNFAQLCDIGLTTGLVAGLVATASGTAIPAGIVTLAVSTGLGSVLSKVASQAGNFSRAMIVKHIWNLEHNQIQS